MKSAWKRMLSLLLAAAMVLSLGATGYALDGGDEIVIVDPEAAAAAETQPEPAAEERELELEELDPSTLGVRKLGEEAEEGIALVDTEDGLSARELDPDALVRVSIFLDGAAALEAGYPMRGVGVNASAIAYRDSLRAAQDALIAQIASETGFEPEVRWNLTLAANAVSAWVRAGDIPLISKMAGVRAVERENYYLPPADEAAEPNTANTSENMVGAVEAWDAGYTGAGSRIAIIDTGIDTSHQSFAADPFTYSVGLAGATGELMTQAQVQALASQLNSRSGNYVSAKIPYGYNYVDGNTTINHLNDTQGEHGSHVAGIAAANRYIKSGSSYLDAASEVGAVGMAPDAQLFIMKVFGKSGGAYDSDYMVAIEDAIVLDCDAVNLSLGSSVQGFTFSDSYQDILNNLTDKAHNEGMVVSISAGNSYDFAYMTESGELYRDDVYYHTGGSPGTFVNSLCVAAAQNTITSGTPMEFNGSLNVYYAESTEGSDGTAYSNPALTTIVGSYSYVYIDAVGSAADCSAVNSALSLSGKVVIVNRGELSFSEKGNNAKSYSPKALIVANNADGVIHMDLTDFTGSFPMVSITKKDAALIKQGAVSHSANGITYYTGTMKVTNTQQSVIIDRSEATITDFSSWGVPGSLLMKPEITAPGGDIYSVAGTNKTSSGSTAGGSDKYEYMSGTSMAAPHITGLSAVVAEYLRENPVSGRNAELAGAYSTRAIIQSLLMSTATPMKPEGGYLPVLQQGAGLAAVDKAVSAPSVLMMNEAGLTTLTGAAADGKVKAELGDDPDRAGEYSYSFTLYNLSDTALSYTLHTELFTQRTDGTYALKKTMDLPAGGVSYVWNGASVDPGEESHDVDRDGDTDEADAQAILDYMAFLLDEEEIDLEAADLDGDGLISSYDAHLLLNWEPEGGAPLSGYVLPAHGTAEVTVTIRLTAAQKEFLEESFPRGAYLEGFTYVSGTASTREGESLDHVHSIPILGFYGSWTDPSMFDNMSYIDGLYGAERLPYSGSSDTNYLMVNYSGANARFSGNPYIVEKAFPADRLALNSNSNLIRISYNLIRSAGTTGFAVTRLDDEGDVAAILSSSVVGSSVSGQYYSNSSGWQNTGTKIYSINRTAGSYGLAEGDSFRVGFYAIPEYNGMLTNDSYDASGSGVLGQGGFNSLLRSNTLGMGALVGYDFVVDDTEPVIGSASLSGSTLSVQASDNENLAYVAVLSLDGTVKYAEAAPGSDSYSISFDASDAIANAHGYVAVFAGDYAGNEAARAIRVNDNAYEDKTVYVLTDSLTAGSDYLIVSRGTAGGGYALGHSDTTVATNEVTVLAGNSATQNKLYIDSADVASTSVWTAGSGITLKNGSYYLGYSGFLSYSLAVSTTSRNWSYSNSRLSVKPGTSTYYLRYNNGFSISTTQSEIYLYQKTVIRTEVDPYTATGISIAPGSLDLYKGNETDLTAKVTPITAEDRSVTWSSSDSSIAAVDAYGHVTAVSAGTATVTATANGNSEVSASCPVTVVSVNKELRAIVWDEEGGVYFSSFNANSLPAWTKQHSDDKQLELHGAFMQSSSALYAATLEGSSLSSTLYTVNRNSYALTTVGENFVGAMDLARGLTSTTYSSYAGMVYCFGPYLLAGNYSSSTVNLDDGSSFTGTGIPYGMADLSETTGAYIAGVAAKSVGSSSSSYYVLDENGVIWQTTLSYSSSAGFSFSTPTKVVETGVSTSFVYQSLYYDGTWLYWSHQTDERAELIVINPSSGKVYHAGDFGENIWPVVGLYVNGSAAPASVDDEVPLALDLQPVAVSRDQLTAAVCERIGVSARSGEETEADPEIVVPDEPDAEAEPEIIEIEPDGTLDAVRVSVPLRTDSDAALVDDAVVVTVREDSFSTNGYITVAYDPESLSLKGPQSSLAHKALYLDEEKGVITFVYADKDGLPADTVLLELVFSPACEDSTVTVETYEHNQQIEMSGVYEDITVEGRGHKWPEAPDWSWTADHSAATATFVCENDPEHIEVLTATVTTEISAPGCDHEGSTVYTATVSLEGRQYTDQFTAVTPATGHDWNDPVWTWAADYSAASAAFICKNDPSHVETIEAEVKSGADPEPDCEHEGEMQYTAMAEFNGVLYTDEVFVTIPALGHDWNAPTYEWSADNSKVTATRTCKNDPAHVETETVNTTSAVTKPATCEAKGETTYTAVFTNAAFTTQTKTVANIDALGHDWGEPTYEWSADNSRVTATRTCANDPSHVETETVNTTSAVTKPATCEAKGETTYTATFTNSAFTTQTKTVANIDALGHDWGEPTYEWSADNSRVTATRTCKNDPAHVETETVNTTSAVTKPATCEAKGETTYTATFTNSAFTTQTKTVANIDALGHDWNAPTYEWSADNSKVTATRTCANDPTHVETETVNTTSAVTKPATCEAKGETTYTAVFTNAAFTTQTKTVANIDALGHDWNAPSYTWTEDGDGYSVTAKAVCAHDASHVETETVTASFAVITAPTTTSEGLGRYTASFTNALFTTQTRDVTLEKLRCRITITDYTKGGAVCSIDTEQLYRGELEFTVEAEWAVLVAVKNGEDYSALRCTTDAEGVHRFTLDVQDDLELVLAYKGDVNLDGQLRASDGTMIKRSVLGTYTLEGALKQLIADVNGDGVIRASDGTMVAREVLGTYTVKW